MDDDDDDDNYVDDDHAYVPQLSTIQQNAKSHETMNRFLQPNASSQNTPNQGY
jgi:hypothetical protein